jgi:alpha-tubulin suppressor-like RCC1 family protein
VAQIYAGPNTSIAVTKSGLIKMWGENKYGQITDSKDERVWHPVDLKSVPFIALEETDVSLFLGKSNVGYLYSCNLTIFL